MKFVGFDKSSGASNPTWASYHQVIGATTDTLSSKAMTYVDISNLIGSYYVGFAEGGSTNYMGGFQCFALYLTNEVLT